MTCDEAKKQLMDIDNLSAEQQESLEQHAQTCAECAREFASLRSMIELTKPLQAVNVLLSEQREPAAHIALPETDSRKQVWMPGLVGRLSPWLAAASFILAALFIYEQIPGSQQTGPTSHQSGVILNASIYRQQLNKVRDSRTYRANVLCRSPYRKPEQVAQCVRQKFTSL